MGTITPASFLSLRLALIAAIFLGGSCLFLLLRLDGRKGGGVEVSISSPTRETQDFHSHPPGSPHPMSQGFYSFPVPDCGVADLPWLGLEEWGEVCKEREGDDVG